MTRQHLTVQGVAFADKLGTIVVLKEHLLKKKKKKKMVVVSKCLMLDASKKVSVL